MEDSAIIQLFLQRDQRAIEETRNSHGSKLQRLAMNILKNNQDAEESVSDTYFKAWNTIPPQKPNHFFAYLAKICRFIAFGILDRKNARKRSAQIVELTAEMEQCIPAACTDMDMQAEELGALITRFLKGIPLQQRLIFMRRYWYAESVSAVADRLHISESNVKTTLYRTRQRLKKFLEDEGVQI